LEELSRKREQLTCLRNRKTPAMVQNESKELEMRWERQIGARSHGDIAGHRKKLRLYYKCGR
jgi:hypothetical protein